MQHAEGYVRSEIDHGIATIEFFHPSSNALPAIILEDLAKTINDIGIDDRVKVIILRSAGDKAFCAGASFDELVAISNDAEGKKFFSGFAHVINAMRKCHKLIIGRVHGKAVGGGVGLIAATDYAIATDSAAVKLSELAVGIGPFVVGPAVERKVGVSCFSQLAIDATEWRSAEWGKKHGLYAELHSNVEELDDAVKSLADRLAHSSPEAMWELKKIFWQGTDHWDTLLSDRAAISGRLVLSSFTKNAINAFKAKSVKS
ncbi:enoyl-CoA hydratase/isomerase family protein [Taibaiella soli]|uniref:Enoyl-CoA hydratase/isomerase family protein n=1 Tax=Taibaiella soli TaxID=1649169 RepID=A0A2W2B955_9BACT|nr:enoyl-CoA hydratase/isomerase family protein [Taibaiella soli]PZF72447.1 enoyl-CoA hydratase/isomerase family protein [Taibaiella soli]